MGQPLDKVMQLWHSNDWVIGKHSKTVAHKRKEIKKHELRRFI
jgi:hypothetical protein